MWDGCNSEVSKAIRPSFKDYEESQRNETAIKFGALNPAINKPGEKYTTHRMGEDFFGVMADENRWFYVTQSVPKHKLGTNTRRVGFICSSHRGVSSVPFPFRFPFQSHCELVSSLF